MMTQSKAVYRVVSIERLGGHGDVRTMATSAETTSPVVERIRKALDLALRADTPAAEAEHAMRAARRQMHAHNLDQARVMLATAAGAGAAPQMVASRWAACVCAAATDRRFNVFAWHTDLLAAAAHGFEVRRYTAHSSAHNTFVFYGLDGSAELAARAFVRYLEHVETLARAYVPPRDADNNDDDGTVAAAVARSAVVRQARLAYRSGVARGLHRAFDAERAEERAHVARATASLAAAAPCSEQALVATRDLAAHQALVVGSDGVYERALDGLKLGRGAQHSRMAADLYRDAFRQGERDAKHIRLR